MLSARRCSRPGRQHQAVDHQLDVVLELLVELGRRVDLVQLAVDLDPLEARAQQLGHFLPVLALAAAHDRAQQVEPRPLRHGHHAVDHLRDGLALDRQAGGRRVGDADAGEQEAQIVVDLGDGADRRARVLRGRLLLDRDRGRQAGDEIDVRLLHQLEELARVGRQALDVATLAVGVDGIEGERALAGAGQPGDHHQPVARQIEVDRAEIMLARAADADEVVHGAKGSVRRCRHLLRRRHPLRCPLAPRSASGRGRQACGKPAAAPAGSGGPAERFSRVPNPASPAGGCSGRAGRARPPARSRGSPPGSPGGRARARHGGAAGPPAPRAPAARSTGHD